MVLSGHPSLAVHKRLLPSTDWPKPILVVGLGVGPRVAWEWVREWPGIGSEGGLGLGPRVAWDWVREWPGSGSESGLGLGPRVAWDWVREWPGNGSESGLGVGPRVAWEWVREWPGIGSEGGPMIKAGVSGTQGLASQPHRCLLIEEVVHTTLHTPRPQALHL